MLLWEVRQPPFINFVYNCELALKIISGMRPKVIPGTPLEYKKLMEQCWNADLTKRSRAHWSNDKISGHELS
jgi:hypothetical protein